MTIQITQNADASGWAMLLYGPSGIGKTTFAVRAPKALILNLENGLKGINLVESETFTTNFVENFSDAMDVIKKFAEQDRFKTLIIDSVSKFQDLLIKNICDTANKASLGDFGFGAGYAKLSAEAYLFCEHMLRIRNSGKNVILIAHQQIETFQDPEAEAYDRFSVNLDKRISDKVQAAVDYIWFVHQEKTIKETNAGRNRAVHRGRVLVQTHSSGGVVAKSRGKVDLFLHLKNEVEDGKIWRQL